MMNLSFFKWPRWDSNPYVLRHHPLKMASLPVSPRGHKQKKSFELANNFLWPDWGSNPGPQH